MLNNYLQALLAGCVLSTLAAGALPDEPFSDSFEGEQLYSYWTLSQQYGAVTLSSDQAYSGAKSLKFVSSAGGNRDIELTHKFDHLTKGDVSIAFYDVAPGQETLYEYLSVFNSADPSNGAGVGTKDYDAQCYSANLGTNGPNANCGIYPQAETAPVRRTSGWHVFSIYYDDASISIAIDGELIYSAVGDYKFDTVAIIVKGPYWRPDSAAYFDNFSFTPLPSKHNLQARGGSRFGTAESWASPQSTIDR